MGQTLSQRSIELKPLDISSDEYRILFDELQECLRSIGLDVSDEDAEICLKHLLYVQQVNEYINLTRINDLHEGLILHIADSLSLLKYINDHSRKLLDMGTGAGFPGIPLATVLGIDCVLLDSVGKKIKAVDAFASKLSLKNVSAIHNRIESFTLDNTGAFDCVVARALASLPILIEYATPLLGQEGELVVAKGNLTDAEFESGLKAAEICGLTLICRDSFDLPRSHGHREVLVFKRDGTCSAKLPRTPGTAKRSPLA